MTDSLRIRNAEVADISAVIEIENHSFSSGGLPWATLRQYLDLSRDGFLVAEHQGKIVGFVVAAASALSSDKARAWLLAVAVVPEQRGRGIARRLCANVFDILAASNLCAVRATVHPQNTASKALLAGLGFNRIGEEDEYFGCAEPRLILEAVLGHVGEEAAQRSSVFTSTTESKRRRPS